MANARSDKGQRVTKTRSGAHAARTPIGDTRRIHIDALGPNAEHPQLRQRTRIATFNHYPEDWEISALMTSEMRDGNSEYQIRKISGGFGLYRRDLL